MTSLVEIRLAGELTLRSCSSCDRRWWLRADEPTQLGDVLTTFSATAGASHRRLDVG